jgi:UPF0716 protein FxsA
MCLKLFIAFVIVPLVEVMLLIELGKRIGFWPTVAIQVGTGLLGASLAREQGMAIWARIQKELAERRMPAAQLVDGLLVLAAGIVLLTPGLLTDAVGFLLLIPWTRRFVNEWLRKRFRSRMERGQNIYTIHIDDGE